MPRNELPKDPKIRTYDSLPSDEAIFSTAQELFWRLSEHGVSEAEPARPLSNPCLTDLVRLTALKVINSIPFKDQPNLKKEWEVCIKDWTIQDFMSGTLAPPHPPPPPSQQNSGALRDADATLRLIHFLLQAKTLPDALSESQMETIIFMTAWAAGYCESSRHLRYFEAAARTGQKTRRATAKGGRWKAEVCRADYALMLKRFNELLDEDQHISYSETARMLVEEGLDGGRSIGTIRKILSKALNNGSLNRAEFLEEPIPGASE